ncbi:spore-associated protein A [Nonomuraea sp. NPDC050153]|uniref:spore-associated protein A n=1 Tax=Nonomuraea sp. NPDC050153 TaxID=3364359 RepID=UPI00379B0563
MITPLAIERIFVRTRKLATLLAGAALAASTTLVAGAAPASAAGPCGSGYSRVGVYSIGIEKYGYRTGILEVYYSSSTGKNCALTYGDGPYANTVSWKGVTISRGDGSGKDEDAKEYKYYAGPVYVSARGGCIDVEGISPAWTSVKLNNVHCG